MGEETERYRPLRQTIVPDWEVQYPPSIRAMPADRFTYLADLEPERAEVGWLPAGKTWGEMNGPIKLVTDGSGDGREYAKSLFAQSASELVYRLDGQYKTFVAAAGIGTTLICSVAVPAVSAALYNLAGGRRT